MDKTEEEKTFEEWRDHLHHELMRLVLYKTVLRQLNDRKSDRLEEMNIAPAFFQTVESALFTAIVLWVTNLFDKRSERGLWRFLRFSKQNFSIFSIAERQRRRQYPNGHWMLEMEPVTTKMVSEHERCLNELSCIHRFKIRRDKFHAHFDKAFSFNRSELSKAAPIAWSDLDKVVDTGYEILNTYATAYDGTTYSIGPCNSHDVGVLLDCLHKYRIKD